MGKFRRISVAVVAVAVLGAGLVGCDMVGEPEGKGSETTAPPPPPATRKPRPTPPPTTPPGTEDFGPAVAQQGDVKAFAPVRDGAGVRVPVVIVNTGGRAFYDVTLRVTGPDGYEASGGFSTDTVGVYPGASWPTEVTVETPGRKAPAPAPAPEQLKVEIVEVERR